MRTPRSRSPRHKPSTTGKQKQLPEEWTFVKRQAFPNEEDRRRLAAEVAVHDTKACSVVRLSFPFSTDFNVGVELSNQEFKAPISHQLGATRMQQPDYLMVYVEGEKDARLLADALIFAGKALLDDLNRENPIDHGCGVMQINFPWDTMEPGWCQSWNS